MTSPHATVERGTLFVVAAPSGAGKSSLVNAVLAREPGIALSISYTSRAPRPGERHAHHYHFVDKAEFERMIAAGDFFEYALVHGDYKGTARQSVEPQLAAGKDVLLEIDWQGARQVRQKIPEAISVFILPPSTDTLETAANELRSIFVAHRLRRDAQARRHAGLFSALMDGYGR